jgi:ABC-type transport system substrate-binding protein
MKVRFGRASLSLTALVAPVLLAAVLVAPVEVAAPEIRWHAQDRDPREPHGPRSALDDGHVDRDHRRHYLEGLYTRDKSYQPIPMLAEGHTVSADKQGLQHLRLRHGVIFHNGKEMTAEDVVASLKPLAQDRHVRQGARAEGRDSSRVPTSMRSRSV